MAPGLRRTTPDTSGMIRLGALVAIGLLATAASGVQRDDDSEVRVRAAPQHIPALSDRLAGETSWTLSNGEAIDWGSVPKDAAESVQRVNQITAAEAEIARQEQALFEAEAEAERAVSRYNAKAYQDWLDASKANEARCRLHPKKPCPIIAEPGPILRGSNGMQIPYAAAPFQVELRYAARISLARFPGSEDPANAPWELRHKCGGGLIAPDWVLTAAHCASPADLKDGLEVHLGSADISRDGGVVLAVDRVIPHPGYRPSNMYFHDIALLHIVTKNDTADTGYTRTLELAHDYPRDQAAVFVPGWGRIVDASKKPVAILRRYAMKIVPRGECTALPGFGPTKIHDGVVCAGGGGVKTCEGDSGGPLVLDEPGDPRDIDYKVVGIVSWNKSTCDGKRDPRPGVYTAVAPYAKWIEDTIRAPSPTAR